MTRYQSLLLAAAALLLPAAAHAQSVDWAVAIPGPALTVWDMDTTPSGGVLLTGIVGTDSGFFRGYDAAGNLAFNQTVSGAAGAREFTRGTRITVDTAGNAFLVGEEGGSVRPQVPRTVLNKFAPDGTLLWTATDVPPNQWSLVPDNVGGAYLSTGASYGIYHYGSGNVLGVQLEPRSALLTSAPGAEVFLAHRDPLTQIQVARRDADGGTLWNTTLEPMVQQLGAPQHFVSNAAGSLALITVGTTPPAKPVYQLTLLSANGVVQATRDLNLQPSYLFNSAATMDPAGNVYIVGGPKDQTSPTTLLIHKFRPDGSLAWSFDVGAALPWDFDRFSPWQPSLAYDNQGRLALYGVGFGPNGAGYQPFLTKLSTVPEPSGTLLLALPCAAALLRRRPSPALSHR